MSIPVVGAVQFTYIDVNIDLETSIVGVAGFPGKAANAILTSLLGSLSAISFTAVM